MLNALTFLAFVTTLSQILCVRFGHIRVSWWLCVVGCNLWFVVAWLSGSVWLGVQQLVFISLAFEALYRGRNV